MASINTYVPKICMLRSYIKNVKTRTNFIALNTSSLEIFKSTSGSDFQNNFNVRFKQTNSSKARGTMGRKRTKVRGCFREDGEWVSAGTILVKQLGLKYFPGLNVGLGTNRNLYAMEHGTVMITTEKVNPNWDLQILHTFFGQYSETDAPLYMTYFHVMTDPMPQEFKLVDQI